MKKQTLTLVALIYLICFSMFWYSCEKEDGLIESGGILTKTELMQYDSLSLVIETDGVERLAVIDYDGNVYKTIQIGDQVWMAENLKTTKFNDGMTIPLVTDNVTWLSLSSPGYSAYDNNRRIGNTFGALYNWYAVETGNLCPAGWHAPTDEEWTILANYLGGSLVAGGKLKEVGTTHWYSPNDDATNETGFTALAGGYRDYKGPFGSLGYVGHWWSSTEISTTQAWNHWMFYENGELYRYEYGKRYGLSVRCVKD